MKICSKCGTKHSADIACPRCVANGTVALKQTAYPNLNRGGTFPGGGRPKKNKDRQSAIELHRKVMDSFREADFSQISVADRLRILKATSALMDFETEDEPESNDDGR